MQIAERIQNLLTSIDRQKITLLAVSKAQNPQNIVQAFQAGIINFGENYLQEAIPKIESLKNYPLVWHFIGHIQTNKCKKISENFSWVHTLDRVETAQKLNSACSLYHKNLNVCIQVNLFSEPQKSGIDTQNLDMLIQKFQDFPHLKLRGLMTILPEALNAEQQYKAYLELAQLKTELNLKYHINMDTLSMGMSNDYLTAIKAGSTIIRLGQAIFGPRIK